MKEIDISTLEHTVYDVVIVGAGVAGAIVAKELANAGRKVLVMEAGKSGDLSIEGYHDSLMTFYKQAIKNNNSPYTHNPNADSPQANEVTKYKPGTPNVNGYFVHNGPISTDSTYLRSTGGSTIHWQACAFRMFPDDFKSRRFIDLNKFIFLAGLIIMFGIIVAIIIGAKGL